VHLRANVPAGDPVVQVARDLEHAEVLPEQVDREAGLDAEPTREWTGRGERLGGEAPLARQRLGGLPPGGLADAVAGEGHHETVPASGGGLLGEQRDRHVGVAGADRPNQRGCGRGRPLEVGVEEQQEQPALARPTTAHAAPGAGELRGLDRRGAGLHRGCLALVPPVPRHLRASRPGHDGGPVG